MNLRYVTASKDCILSRDDDVQRTKRAYLKLPALVLSGLILSACSSGSDDQSSPGTAPFLPQTGVKTSTLTGDDGDWQAGVAWPNQRFAANDNGTVTDNLTGLVWLQNLECVADGRTWADAITFANTLDDDGSGRCGLSDSSQPGDWRVPNVRELHSVSYRGDVDMAFPFSGAGKEHYWSSTSVAINTDHAWVVLDGFVWDRLKSEVEPVYPIHVWPVRNGPQDSRTFAVELHQTGQTVSYMSGDDGDWQAGVPIPSPRYVDEGNGTLRDTLTGLVWLRDTGCLTDSLRWGNAILAANAFADHILHVGCDLSDGSKAGDWRLPNVIEMLSVVDFGQAEPALSSGHPAFGGPGARPGWTSTTLDSEGAFGFVPSSGSIAEYDGFDFQLSVWPVRNTR